VSSDRGPEEPTDEEVLSWARRRGLVTLLIFAIIGVVFVSVWLIAR
jgi:hypothetical protein